MLLSAAVGGTVVATTASATGSAEADTGTTATVPFPAPANGIITLDLSLGTTFTGSIAANTTFDFTNWPTGGVTTEPTVISTQTAPGGYTIAFESTTAAGSAPVTWLSAGTPPQFMTGAGQTNVNSFLSPDGGASVYGQGSTPITSGYAIYGNGGDGAVVLDGPNISTYSSFLGNSGAYYYLLRDVYLTSLTVGSGISLQLGGGWTAPFRVFCTGTVSTAPDTGSIPSWADWSGGIIVSGANSVNCPVQNTTAGSLVPGAFWPPPAPSSGNGDPYAIGTTGPGLAGGNVNGWTGPTGVAGGAGGNAGGTTGNKGGAGGASSLPSGYSLPQGLPWANTMMAIATGSGGSPLSLPGGASGGAGAGDGTYLGGAGGNGGNPLFISAYNLVNNGTIQAVGGNGSPGGGNATGGVTSGGNGGGGGGGQAGPIVLIYSSYSGNAPISIGGNGGAKNGTGSAGANGGPGWIMKVAN